ncbi:MAG TPA: VWA domain-containing protein [Thermoanaerobaculia bacterium]|nr:VWA domain-containing protein [Thermoanaerobaculia bacterium]
MTRFADPLWFALALLVIARVVLLVRDRRKRVGAFGFSSMSLTAPATRFRRSLSDIPFFLECIALLLLIAALARPQRVTKLASSDRFGIDIVIALDASGSMAAEDFRPRNRFTVAKDLIGDFVRGRTDDRIGLVTFGSRAATRVPITYDRRITEGILDKAELGEHGNGTAIGHALATSVNRLRKSRTRSRVIILVTDGVNNSGSIEPRVAAQLAAQSGIKVYTIGVGSEGPVPLPVKRQNPFTGEIETIYTHIRGELDEPTLRAIAAATGGEFFRATDARALALVLERIDALEKTRLTSPRREQIVELYGYPLIAGLAFLGLALLGGETFWLKVAA